MINKINFRKDENGISLQVVIIVAVLALAASGASIVIYNAFSDTTSEVSELSSGIENEGIENIPNNVGELEEDEETPPLDCRGSQIPNSAGDGCEDPKCLPGQFFDGATCTDRVCTGGQRFNIATDACEPIMCGLGEFLNSNNVCEGIGCGFGNKLNSDGDCIEIVCDNPAQGLNLAGDECEDIICLNGKEFNLDIGICLCPIGQKINSDGGDCQDIVCPGLTERYNFEMRQCEMANCANGEVFNQATRACDTIICPAGQRLNRGQCERRSISDSPRAVRVEMQVAVSEAQSCALLTNGQVKCWGINGRGEAGFECSTETCKGTGAQRYSEVPVLVENLPPAKYIAVGFAMSCAIAQADGSVLCWGEGPSIDADNDLVIDPAPIFNSHVPTQLSFTGARIVSLIGKSICVVTDSNRYGCIGSNFFYAFGTGADPCVGIGCIDEGGEAELQVTLVPIYMDSSFRSSASESSQTISQLSYSGSHICVITNPRKEVWCWGGSSGGANEYGELGHTDRDGPITRPTQVQNLPGPVSQVAAGAQYTCALLEDFRVFCWGRNDAAQLGSYTETSDGELIASISTPTEIRFGETSAGEMFAFGFETLSPSQIAASTRGACVVTNPDGRLVLDPDGTGPLPSSPIGPNSNFKVTCWGHKLPGSFEVGISSGFSIPGSEVTTSISAGGVNWCHITIDSEVKCRGINDRGQLGNPDIPTASLSNIVFALRDSVVGIP